MDSVCYSCKEVFKQGSMKTPRSRFKIMGLIPPEGMSALDRICNKCLHKMYEQQVKQERINQLKKNFAKDLLGHRNKDFTIRKRIQVEKKKKFL